LIATQEAKRWSTSGLEKAKKMRLRLASGRGDRNSQTNKRIRRGSNFKAIDVLASVIRRSRINNGNFFNDCA